MMFRSVIVLGCILSFSATNDALAARGDPCTSDGQLKRWAEKYYDADYCAPATVNTAPTLTITSPTSGSSVEAGTTVTLKASAIDKEDGDISSKVFWYSTVDGNISNVATLSIGDHTLTAAVYDSAGLVAKDSIKLSVTEVVAVNTAPAIMITAPGDYAEFTSDQTISLQAAANDVEDGDLSTSVLWSSSLDGTISANTALSVGTHTITATVADAENLTASDSISVTITEVAAAATNSAPTVSITSPTSGNTVEEGAALVFKASAYDNEDGDLSGSVFWYSSIDGRISNFTTLSVGVHTIYAGVKDSDGQAAKDKITLTVTQQQPTATVHAVTLTWNIPTNRTDGEVLLLEELAGYRINWENLNTGEQGSVTVDGGLTTYYRFTEMNSGSYLFSLNTIDTTGLISDNSPDMPLDLY